MRRFVDAWLPVGRNVQRYVPATRLLLGVCPEGITRRQSRPPADGSCMDEQPPMSEDLHDNLPPDPGLRRVMKWVFGALVLTVLVAVLVVEFTLRWFGHP